GPARGARQGRGDLAALPRRRAACLGDALGARAQRPPRLSEHASENLLLRGEVVVEQAVGDAGLLRDVADAGRVVALAREHAHGCIEEQPALVLLVRQGRLSLVTSCHGAAFGPLGRGSDPVPTGALCEPRAGATRRAGRATVAAGR